MIKVFIQDTETGQVHYDGETKAVVAIFNEEEKVGHLAAGSATNNDHANVIFGGIRILNDLVESLMEDNDDSVQ